MASNLDLAIIGPAESTEQDEELEPPLARCASQGAVPFTYPQQLYWHIVNLDERRSTRSCARALRLRGRLDRGALGESVSALVRRHDALRVKVVKTAGTVGLVADEAVEGRLEIADVSHVLEADREDAARRIVEEMVNGEVDVTIDPLFVATLLKLDDEDHILVIAMEHLISDALSLTIAFRDIWKIYVQITQGRPPSLPEISVQFRDYALWQNGTRDWWNRRHGQYWNEHLAGAARVRLSQASGVVGAAKVGWGRTPIRLNEERVSALRELSRRQESTLALALLAAYSASVLGWANTDDLVVQLGSTGRVNYEIENTIGFFASTLYIRVRLREWDVFSELIRRVTSEYWNAYIHHDCGRLQAQRPRADYSFNTGFAWFPHVDAGRICVPAHGNAIVEHELFPIKISIPEDIDWDCEPGIILWDSGDRVTGEVVYRLGSFTEVIAERFAQNFIYYVSRMLEDPQGRIKA